MNTWSRKELKEKAKVRLKVTYWKCVLVGIIATIISGGAAGLSAGESSKGLDFSQSKSAWEAISQIPSQILMAIGIVTVFAIISIVIIVGLLHVLLLNPLEIGCKRFFHKNLNENADIKEVCYTYDMGYKNGVTVLFFRDIYLIFWTLLFVIPGIVKLYEYAMIPYILSENPEMKKEDVFALSKKMMKGNKWRAFILDLSFILWDILGTLTFGILNLFYVTPYKKLAQAGLYEALKNEHMQRQEQ